MKLRLTLTSAVAVILASVSLYPLIQNASWFWAGMGAVAAAAIAGIATRLPTLWAALATSVLALVAVGPLLTGPAWGLRALGAAVVAVTACSRPQLRTLQVLACPIAYLSALLIYLNAAFAAPLSIARFVPTRASVSFLSTLLSQGMAERYFEPPVPSIPGILLVAAGGIGLMAAATDLLAVRLRSPAIAGLPLLALYCVRITTSARQGGVGATIVFCLGMIGYLALLAADGRERLRIWGRLVTVWDGPAEEAAGPSEAPDTRALAASGRRIGLAAACIALVIPLLVPGINVHDLFRTESADGPGSGGSGIALPNPLDQMRQQLLSTTTQTVLTYKTTARDPRYQYLQVYVLNYSSSAQTWNLVLPGASAVAGNGSVQPDPGVAAGTPVTRPVTKITLSQGTVGYDAKLGVLPLPYAPEKLVIQQSGWLEDRATQMVYTTDPHMSGLPYTVTSTEAIPTQKEESAAPSYPASIRDSYLSFPAGPHGELAELARQITSGASTPYEKAQKLQDYFLSGKFSYSLDPSLPNGIAGLIDFLYTERSGYCQQFAFAMAALARLAGIPSRIAVGYTAGTSAGKGTWKVTTADAHAWPELYFTGMGWLRFEPTPGGAEGQGTATVPQYAGGPPSYGTTPVTLPTSPALSGRTGKGGSSNLFHLRRPGTGAGSSAAADGGGHSIIPWILLAAGIAAAAGLAAPPAARLLIRRRRLHAAGDAALAHAAWRELRDDLADYGFSCRASESPRAVAARIGGALRLGPLAQEALGRVAAAEERARYATAPLPSPTLRLDSTTVRRALAEEAGWVRRWRARLLPASVLAPVRPALQHALDVFGWMDAARLRFRGGRLRAEQN
jgi:transglutaminase-like putative cysteine protease